MWTIDMDLTDIEYKKAQPREKQYHLSDNNSLSLQIDPNGKNIGLAVWQSIRQFRISR